MTGSLEIEGVKLSSPYTVEVSGSDLKASLQRLDVKVDIRNYSKTLWHNIISDLRNFYYDNNTDTLSLFFSEEKLTEHRRLPVIHKHPPTVISILPEQTAEIKASIPLILKRIVSFHKSGQVNIEESNISKVKHILCRIAYNQTPLLLDRSESTEDMVNKIIAWSQVSEKIIDIEL